MKPPSLTIGIEEEYQIIDPNTREGSGDAGSGFSFAQTARVRAVAVKAMQDRIPMVTGLLLMGLSHLVKFNLRPIRGAILRRTHTYPAGVHHGATSWERMRWRRGFSQWLH